MSPLTDSAYERRAMTISPEINSTTAAIECPRCGARLTRNHEPDVLEVGSDSLRAFARHRCVPGRGLAIDDASTGGVPES